MGCCSSNNTISHSASPEKDLATTQNTELVDHHRLQQQQAGNAQSESSDDEDVLPRSFTNNRSIVKEVMRLEELEMNHDPHNMEIKSNENSEDLRSNDPNQSFGEFGKPNVDQSHEEYHPFGLIQTQREEDSLSKQAVSEDLDALYQANLKGHGFDADKFRNANASMTVQNDAHQASMSADLSSFASSQMSSQIPPMAMSDDMSEKENHNLMNDINEYIDEEEEDLMMEELSRSIVNPMFQNDRNEHDEVHYIEHFKHMKKDQAINNVMDDQDEELMDAILSLDLDH
eukprot:194603_1